jgi:hypothetical protein
LEELIMHLKECTSQTNPQQFYNGFGMQGRPFLQSDIVMEFIADGLQGFIYWYVSEESDGRRG